MSEKILLTKKFKDFLKDRDHKQDLSKVEDYLIKYTEEYINFLDQLFYHKEKLENSDLVLGSELIADVELAAEYTLKFFPQLYEDKKHILEEISKTKRKLTVENFPNYLLIVEEDRKVEKIPHIEMVQRVLGKKDNMLYLLLFEKDLRDVLRYRYAVEN